MRPPNWSLVAAATLGCLAVPAESATYSWTRGGGANSWNVTTNWSPTAPSTGPVAGDAVVIDTNTGTTNGTALNLSGNRAAASILFTGGTTKWIWARPPNSGSLQSLTLTLTGGITADATSGPAFVGYANSTVYPLLNLILSGNQAITNDSASALAFGNVDNYVSGTYQPGCSIQTVSGGIMTVTFAGSGSGDIVVNGEFNNGGGGAVVSTVVNRPGGAVVFNANNGASGAVSVQAGTLRFGSGGTQGRAGINCAIDIAPGATLAINRTDAFNLGNVFSGGGSLVSSGSGTVRLTGSSTFAGATTITAGTMQIGNSGTTGYFAGTMAVAAGAGVAVSRTDAVTIPGAISGLGGFTKFSSGLATLSGSNSYAGLTAILGGTLAVSGDGSIGTGGLSLGAGGTASGVFQLGDSSSAVYVLPATGDLTGSGTLAGLGKTLQVLGSFSPGNSPGTVTLDGVTLDLSTSATSTFEFTSPSFTPGSYDLVAGSGTSILGGVLNLVFTGGTFANQANAAKIFDVSGGLAGGFSAVTFSGLAEGQSATFDASTGFVSVTLVPEPAALGCVLLGGGCAAFAAWRARRRAGDGR